CTDSGFSVHSSLSLVVFFFFFFQAEDGIRDFHVTGVQTCALPILSCTTRCASCARPGFRCVPAEKFPPRHARSRRQFSRPWRARSEERRVGKECRSRGGPYR